MYSFFSPKHILKYIQNLYFRGLDIISTPLVCIPRQKFKHKHHQIYQALMMLICRRAPLPTDINIPFALTVLFSYNQKALLLKIQVTGKNTTTQTHHHQNTKQTKTPQPQTHSTGRNSDYALMASKRTLLSSGSRCPSRTFSRNSPKNERIIGRTSVTRLLWKDNYTTYTKTPRPSLAVLKHLAKSTFAPSQCLIHQLCVQSIAR